MSINSFFGEGHPKEAMQRKRNKKSLNFPSMSSYPPANPRKELSDEEISKLVPEHICAVHFKVAKKHSAAHSEDDLFEGIGDADFSFIEGDDEEEYSVNNNISVDDDYHQTTMEFDENAFIVLKPLHSEEEVFLQPREVPMDDGLINCDNF